MKKVLSAKLQTGKPAGYYTLEEAIDNLPDRDFWKVWNAASDFAQASNSKYVFPKVYPMHRLNSEYESLEPLQILALTSHGRFQTSDKYFYEDYSGLHSFTNVDSYDYPSVDYDALIPIILKMKKTGVKSIDAIL